MTRIPRPPNTLADVMRCCAELTEYLTEIDPAVASHNTLISRTTKGTLRNAMGIDTGVSGVGGPMQFHGQFDPTKNYNINDIVICETGQYLPLPSGGNELDAGNQAGTYIAQDAVLPGDLHPGLDATKSVQATATPTIGSGGILTGATITNPGFNYVANVTIIISGIGTGGAAHAVVGNGKVQSIVIDSAGSGYDSSTGFTIPNPPTAQKWGDFALFRTRRWTLERDTQRIVIDVGRDSASNLSIKIFKGFLSDGITPDPTQGMIDLDVTALLAITTSGANYHIMPREWEVCISDAPMHAIFLSSAPY